MQFEHYVMNYDFNAKKVVQYNIFNNIHVQEATEREIRKYLRAPNKYMFCDYFIMEKQYGFNALCRMIDGIIKWQEWSRSEYEISVGAPFEKDISNLQKIDCYEQCKKNIPAITRECIYQYKQQLKKDN